MYKKFLLVLSVLFLSYFLYCSEKTEKDNIVFTTILPVKYLVNRIANGEFIVYSLMGKNMDPHNFNITPEQIKKLSKAKLLFTIGLESEESIISNIKKVSPDINIINISKEIGLKEKETHFNSKEIGQEDTSQKIEEHRHIHHESKDPHIWTSPNLLKKICFTINKYITELEPTKKDSFLINLNKVITQIDSIDLFLKKNISPYKGRFFFVYHPSFGYLAEDYGLIQVSVEVNGKEPTVKEMKNLIEIARREKPHFIFVQPQFSSRAASVIAKEIGCEIFQVDPLAEDIIDELRNFGSALKRNFENVKQ